ncbi:GntR family transcriptional regulator [Bradyrhizobium sp. NP1]|jgi:GntR family transcriptional regulator|uniref:GntR family transcriptional regulator n=1 Tax=Bradyrhizobium sp. NP1 TaxID=3049772 RepID=UPI0025A542F1|nr:GntR family transcriptional regulator [Bradyrhizobium sp. NP1]WJR80456.1 GntR family transcriptional regulator [Bradyrhizobium sp. NP1]
MADKPRKQRPSRYRDIAGKLQKEVRLGRYGVGDLLPTETELMAQHAASRQTVREALRILIDQGLIVRRAGLGSVVIAAEPPVLFTHSVTSLNEWLRYSNETYREVVATREITADRKLAGLLKCEPGKHWFLIEAVRRADQFAAPLGWVEIYVLRKFAGVVKRSDHGRAPVHEQIARMFGQTTEYAQMEIFARGMPAGIARALKVKPGSPALTVVRRYYGLKEELFEVTVTTHPEGRYTYSMDMQRSLRPRA